MSELKILPEFQYLYFYKLESGTSVGIHMHNCYELVYYLDGTGETPSERGTFKYKPGKIMLYEPFVKHDEHHFSNVAVCCLTFSHRPPINVPTGIYHDNGGVILGLLMAIRDEQAQGAEYCGDMTRALISQIIVKLLRHSEHGGAEDSFLSVYKYINDHFNTDIDIEKLAKITSYSYGRFRHLFKAKTGVSPMQYIIDVRLKYAKTLLAGSTLSISNIATGCGFSDISQFSVSFKKSNNLTPSEYRRQKGLVQ